MIRILVSSLPVLLLTLESARGVTSILFQPTPYFSELDSPFYPGIVDNAGNGIFLETFEDQALNTPFVREPEGLEYTGSTVRQRDPMAGLGAVIGVDGDDGIIDDKDFSVIPGSRQPM